VGSFEGYGLIRQGIHSWRGKEKLNLGRSFTLMYARCLIGATYPNLKSVVSDVCQAHAPHGRKRRDKLCKKGAIASGMFSVGSHAKPIVNSTQDFQGQRHGWRLTVHSMSTVCMSSL
jgi:hypothetical protein